MTHYEERLERDLQAIRDQVAELGELAAGGLERAVGALLEGNRSLAYEIILRDQIVNRKATALDWACHEFVARHLPSAGHLRFISSVLRLTVELERVGDYVVTICREAVRLKTQPTDSIRRLIDLLSDDARRALRQALEAFSGRDPELARGTRAFADSASETYRKAFAELTEEGTRGARPTRDLFSLLMIFNRLGRVCDQAENICEEAIFTATGQVKPPKLFKILFVDRHGRIASPMALSIARKAYRGEAVFEAASLDQPSPLDPALAEFLDRNGHPAQSLDFRRLSPELVRNSDIVVGLGLDEGELPKLPYGVVFLHWPRESLPEDEAPAVAHFEELYRSLAGRLGELMETIRGAGS